jgi:hypothetical protein
MFMAVSQGKLSWARAADQLSNRAILKILYRSALVVAIGPGFLLLGTASQAQEQRPQIITGERKTPRKKDAGPRAVAVLQVAANGQMSLVPIAILINNKFWDASAYKANPVPMALDTGTVYEAERTGSSQGLFTVGSALHSNAVNAPMPWIGTGAWEAAGTEKANEPAKAEGVPKGIDSSDDRPRLTRNPQPTAAAPASSSPQTASPQSPPQSSSPQSGSSPASQSQSSPSKSSAPSSSSSDEPPRLKRPAEDSNSGASGQGSQAGAPQSGASQGGASAPSGDSKPAQGQTGQGQTGQSQSGQNQSGAGKSGDAASSAEKSAPVKPAESDSGAAEANRPRLRRGKPTQSFADEDFPGYSKPGASLAKANSGKAAKAAADAGPVQLIPAISDAGGPIPHTFTFDWLKDEEGERRQQITDLAKQKLQAYLAAQAKQTIAPKPAAAQARHAQAVKAPEPELSNARMTTYDLWTNNQPVIVFSAEAQMPPGTAEAGHSDVEYSIMLVARTDIYNNLRPLYLGITDKFHLDMTPRLELVDAVDADGDGRGELLFKETSDSGTGWVIYRATADKLWKMYDSLNPE